MSRLHSSLNKLWQRVRLTFKHWLRAGWFDRLPSPTPRIFTPALERLDDRNQPNDLLSQVSGPLPGIPASLLGCQLLGNVAVLLNPTQELAIVPPAPDNRSPETPSKLSPGTGTSQPTTPSHLLARARPNRAISSGSRISLKASSNPSPSTTSRMLGRFWQRLTCL